ncbi:DUF455 family protein [Paenibacillus qinlingensis]|uniref:Ferritin-like domain-containing protein n=1 Tax=Paenibacillus qinlingensis TaxID=1837343 RepID=A0ABU1NQD5_9BACL|nr:DUF455 family protein [Paenibacillus qinlingensis]MDR6549097.1 hypothetical protein [Paenibacillus qinlingensis]
MNEHREVNVMDNEVTPRINANQAGRFYRPKDTANALVALFWLEFELSRAVFGWVPAVKEFETKAQLGRFAYLHNQHAKYLYGRVSELPGPSLDKQDTPAVVRETFERISLAPSEHAFFAGYLYVLQHVYAEYEKLQYRLDPILDVPTFDILRVIMLDRPDSIKWTNEQIYFAGSDHQELFQQITEWRNYVQSVWQTYATAPLSEQVASLDWPIPPAYEAVGPVPSDSAWNVERFPIHVPDSKYKTTYEDPGMSPLHDSIKQMHFINATEMGAAESLCYLYYGVQHMPKQFFFDLARHLWDEIRHCHMGIRRLEQMGYTTSQFKYFKGSPGKGLTDLAAEWFPDMYAGLTMVAEPCSFIKKRKSAEQFWKFGDALSAIQCEFDMADERMHVDFGKIWGPELYKQINDLITAAEMSERSRLRRIEQLGAAATPEEAKKIAKNFPGFCGLSTVELNYTSY